ncbi:MAG: SdrD B-like domain-containing protein [Anaerolineae bacterium]
MDSAGEYGFLAAYRDDPTTIPKDGASPGDAITFTINGYGAAIVGGTLHPTWTFHSATIQVDLAGTTPATPTPTPIPTTGSIVAFVWQDWDRDGEPDADEPPLAGVLVELYRAGQPSLAQVLWEMWSSADLPIASCTTDENGRCTFSDLQPGAYTVQVSPPPGYSIVPDTFEVQVQAGQVSEVYAAGRQYRIFLPAVRRDAL